MSRDRTAPQIAADTARHSGHAILLELNFDSGVLRLCVGPRNVVVGADTYLATGTAMTVEEHIEGADGTEGLVFTLSGLAGGVFDLMADEPYKGRIVRMLELRYDADDQPVGDPTAEYIGRMVAMTSTEDPKDGRHTVTVQTEHFDADGDRPVNLRFSDGEQRRRYPDDKGAEYVTDMTDRVLRRTST